MNGYNPQRARNRGQVTLVWYVVAALLIIFIVCPILGCLGLGR
jgi:predicted nucleic acid-binding Zn ribbon protein